MHIGYDISQTGSSKAGCGYYAHAMILRLLDIAPENRYSLFPSFGDFYLDTKMPIRNPYNGRNVHYGPRHISREAARVFWNKSDAESSVGKPDIIQSNNFWCPIQLTSSRLIYTLYDMGFLIDPSWTTEANRIGCFDGVFRSAMVADWVVAISKASRNHYLSVFPNFPEDRIRVIYPCSRFSNSNDKGQRPKTLNDITAGEFWLNVGTIEPRKNQHFLIEAYSRYLDAGGKTFPLVFAGGKGWLMEDFHKHIKDAGVADNVVMTGYISDSELIWLYRNCYANLYPSKFEGFGLPVLEGMQFGAATVASSSSSIPEVSGKATILLDPQNVESWTQTMLRLVQQPQKRHAMSLASRKQAAIFDWKKSAMSLLELYEKAKTSPKRKAM